VDQLKGKPAAQQLGLWSAQNTSLLEPFAHPGAALLRDLHRHCLSAAAGGAGDIGRAVRLHWPAAAGAAAEAPAAGPAPVPAAVVRYCGAAAQGGHRRNRWVRVVARRGRYRGVFSKHAHAVDTKPQDSTKQNVVAFSHCLQHKSEHCCGPEHCCDAEHWDHTQVIVCCSKAKGLRAPGAHCARRRRCDSCARLLCRLCGRRMRGLGETGRPCAPTLHYWKGNVLTGVQRRMPWGRHNPDSPLRSQGWRCRCAT
jgi:hypothetical protein